jgi:membrane-associated phospholipid phosphatase
LRIEAGMHFPSDVLMGAGVGTLSGILVPYFHNHRLIKNPNLCIIPFTNTMAQGISMSYHFNSQPEHSF